MLYAFHFLETEVQTRLLLRRRFLYDGLHLNLSACRGIPDDRCLGAADKVFCKRVAVFREAEGHGHLAFSCLNLLHHSQFHDILVSLCRVLHFLEPCDYLIFHYFTIVISSNSQPAPPNLSTMKRT